MSDVVMYALVCMLAIGLATLVTLAVANRSVGVPVLSIAVLLLPVCIRERVAAYVAQQCN